MARQPPRLTDLVPTLGADGLDISEIRFRNPAMENATAAPDSRPTPKTTDAPHPPSLQKTHRPPGHGHTRARSLAHAATATARVTTGATSSTADASAPASTSASAARRRLRGPDRRANNSSVASENLDTTEYINLDLSQLHVDSDSDDFDTRPARRAANGSGHARSLSNPFPSLFSHQKKKSRSSHSGYQDSESSGADESAPPVPDLPKISGQARGVADGTSGAHKGERTPRPPSPPRGRRQSFSSGRCITCGSLMRWKYGANAFSCTVCATVNDVGGPAFKSSRPKDKKSGQQQGTADDPISVEETRSVIDNCLRLYLEKILADVPTGNSSSSPAQASSASPVASVASVASVAVGRPGYPNSASLPRSLTGNTTAGEVQGRAGPGAVKGKGKAFDETEANKAPGHAHMPTSGHEPAKKAAYAPPKDRKDTGREAKRIFRPLEDYIVSHIFAMDCLDGSFLPKTADTLPPVPEKDRKYKTTRSTADGNSWVPQAPRATPSKVHHTRLGSDTPLGTSASACTPSRPILIDWESVDEWYDLMINCGARWELIYTECISQGKCTRLPRFMLEQIEANILKGQEHAQRVLFKAIDSIIKRPGRRISESGDFRFLIITLANPLLHASCKPFAGNYQHDPYTRHTQPAPKPETSRGSGPAAGQHSVIIKRILGLMANSSDEWHGRMVSCFAQFSESRFLQTKDLVSGFLAFRLVRYNEKKEESKKPSNDTGTLVPKVAEGTSAASFHAALNQATGSASKKPAKPSEKKILHGDDWQIKAAVRVLGLLFAANNVACETRKLSPRAGGAGARSRLRGQLVPTSDFYVTLLDNSDLIGDFEAWEQHTTSFSFCQYPFLLSVWSKIQILEYEARRQMKSKARDAFFDSIMTRRNFDQHLILNVRRDCLVEDSLKGVSEAIGSSTEDIKKGLRIIFSGEEGIDAGGLRKEWFLLLVREVFNPDHGMFVYDEESQYCYFNPASFETSDQFFLVGVVLGLAIYNSTILDIALPPFAFRKLLVSAPGGVSGPGSALSRSSIRYSLADLAEYRPSLARGLQQLLEFDGDVESTFCLEFTISVDRYGYTDTVPLCPGGETKAVTNANREEYVKLYVRYLLETAVSRQFEPFKRGFFTVCGCNALGLFRPEEIELLVRGSDEPLDIASLRLSASYENWPTRNPLQDEPTIWWLWELMEEASPQDQRKLMTFITGSDRIPATGAASLSIRVLYLGVDTGRFPTARTCFNTLTLYRYASKEEMRTKLWAAVNESEGFGLK